MSKSLKEKVGSGGIDDAVLTAAQLNLEQALSQNGHDWITSQVNDLIACWNAEASKQQDFSSLIKKAIDLKCLAESLDRDSLKAIAASLSALAEDADPEDDVTTRLIDLHIQSIRILIDMSKTGRQEPDLEEQIVDELRTAAFKIVKDQSA